MTKALFMLYCLGSSQRALRPARGGLMRVWYNGDMETKDKIDLLVKRAELVYKKLFIFLAIAGGSWVYGLRDAENTILRVLVLVVFFLTAVAIVLNLLKFGEIQNKLKGFDDD